MHARCLLSFLFLANCVLGHEFPGHAAPEHGFPITLGTEFYVGKYGYWHGGAGVGIPLSDQLSLEIGTHLVRENTDAPEVPSFEAELIREFENGWEWEAFGFAYPRVEGKQAWGVGMRATKRFALQNGIELSPFLGPTYARVRAGNEAGEIQPVHHALLIGGLTVQAGPVSVTMVGSHSFYDQNPAGFETPVDFESMSHFAAYENNDGFPENTAALEISYEVTDWLTFHSRYAVLFFDEETRHAIAFTPAVKLGERVEITGGIQLLRGGEVENDLAFGGLTYSF